MSHYDIDVVCKECQEATARQYVEIPVLAGFGINDCIGTLRILKDSLPPTPTYHFALGYTRNPYNLICISPVPDTYLKEVNE